MFKNKTWSVLLALTAIITLAYACGGDDYFDEYDAKIAAGGGENAGGGEAATAGPVTNVDPATAASVTGVISFEGDVPRVPPVNMSAEPDCVKLHGGRVPSDRVVVNDGKLQHVLVWISKGLEGKSFPVRNDIVNLDQSGCLYKPHVVAVQQGQAVNITNSDDTTHNVHPLPKENREWNKSQTSSAPAIDYTFPRAELKIAVKCNIHPWMQSYIHVVEHPYFSVSGDDGSFEISNLPPGTYTVQALHELFGSKEVEITVGASESKEADFSFSG